MNKIAAFALLLVVLILLIGGVDAQSSENYHLERVTLSKGGGGTASSTNYQVQATIGQVSVGTQSSEYGEACLGFWCGFEHLYHLLLPIIQRN
jgi:hypothetical protein